MPMKVPDFLKGFTAAGAKSRIFIILAVMTVVGFSIYLGTRYFGGAQTTTGPSKVANAPTGLQTVPGGKMSPEFYRAVMQANAQAAQQAKISGGSAVPTLINVPGPQTETSSQGCCNPDNVDATAGINNLVNSGKLSPEDANILLSLAKNNACLDDYSDVLNGFLKQGKLSPEQARQLFECYKKQYRNQRVSASAQSIDGYIKSGQLTVEVADELLALLKNDIQPNDYAEEVTTLVKTGKIASSLGARLVVEYNQQYTQEQSKVATCGLNRMARNGQIASEVATNLEALMKRHASADEYQAELNRLVAAGKMTPEVAAKLLAQYKQQQSQTGAALAANDMLNKELAAADSDIDDLLKSGKISAETARLLKEAMRSKDCHNRIEKLAQEGKIPAEDAKRLEERCQKISATRGLADRLAGATVEQCMAEVKQAVHTGSINADEATQLLAQCQTMVTAGMLGPPPPSTVPGGEDFAKLQQRLQAQQGPEVPQAGPGANTAELQKLSAQAQAAEEQARADRINQMMSVMSNQAQQLIGAWTPPVMRHQQGVGEEKSTKSTSTAQSGTSSGIGGLGGSSSTPSKAPLIKAGSILFAVLETGINSDYPDTPVMATVVSGPFKGAKLLGKMGVTPGLDKVTIIFNLMDTDSWTQTKSVNAFAIDPDTAKTVLASQVDYHYLKRYGALFASSFLSGYASAITQSGSQSTTGLSTTTTTPPLSPSNKIAVALGSVGTALSTAAQGYVNTPPTVQVNAGVGLGILFMADLSG